MHDGKLRTISMVALAAVIALGALLFLPKLFVDIYATNKRNQLTGVIWNASSEQETVVRFAHWAAGYWRIDEKKDFWNRLRGLPKPFKPSKNSISFLSGEGLCTEFVAAARWVLDNRLEVVRHDVLSPRSGHSAISIKLSDGRWVYADPFYGWIFQDENRLLSLAEVRQRLAAGEQLEKYAVRLKPDANAHYYTALSESFDAKEFEAMDVQLRLPLDGRKRWSMGELDGSWQDVQRAGQNAKLTSHFFYVGRRYPTNIRFHYYLPEDARPYQLMFHLTETPTPGALPRFSIRPVIEGKTLRFRLGPSQRILSMDTGTAPGRIWFGIDRFEAIADEPSLRPRTAIE